MTLSLLKIVEIVLKIVMSVDLGEWLSFLRLINSFLIEHSNKIKTYDAESEAAVDFVYSTKH